MTDGTSVAVRGRRRRPGGSDPAGVRLAAGIVAAAVVAGGAFLAGTAGVGTATSMPGNDVLLAGDAALSYTGSGSVTETEWQEEHGSYEVEVELDGGDRVEVRLDRHFTVVGAEAADAGTADRS